MNKAQYRMNKAQGEVSRRLISKENKKGRDAQAQKGVEGKKNTR